MPSTASVVGTAEAEVPAGWFVLVGGEVDGLGGGAWRFGPMLTRLDRRTVGFIRPAGQGFAER